MHYKYLSDFCIPTLKEDHVLISFPGSLTSIRTMAVPVPKLNEVTNSKTENSFVGFKSCGLIKQWENNLKHCFEIKLNQNIWYGHAISRT